MNLRSIFIILQKLRRKKKFKDKILMFFDSGPETLVLSDEVVTVTKCPNTPIKKKIFQISTVDNTTRSRLRRIRIGQDFHFWHYFHDTI